MLSRNVGKKMPIDAASDSKTNYTSWRNNPGEFVSNIPANQQKAGGNWEKFTFYTTHCTSFTLICPNWLEWSSENIPSL
jgi:hypothetical protein